MNMNMPSQARCVAVSATAQPVAQLQAADLATSDFAEHYQKPGIPVVISGLCPPPTLWNLDFLEQQLGSLVFPVRRYGQERYQQDKRQWTSTGSGVEAINLPFSRYVELLRSGEARAQDLYLARCALGQTPLAEPQFLVEAEQRLGLRWPATTLNLWLGSGGHTSCLHYDPMDGTLSQICGCKRVILYPPSQLYNLYPFSVWNHLRYGLKLRSVYSQVYPDAPDLEAFPKFQQAEVHRQETLLRPGDVLFIPAGWWHEVQSLSEGGEDGHDIVCSTNRFWHVYPLTRAVTLWSKWRAHVGGALAIPHTLKSFISAIASADKSQKLRQLLQQL